MSSTIVNFKSTSASPQRMVGGVTKDRATGMVTIDYREPGKVKPTQKSFDPAELIAYQTGAAGFVIAMTTNPIAQIVGELVTKNGEQFLKTESGTVHISKQPNVLIEFQPVHADSREARSVERASKVKVRGARNAVKAGAKESAKSSRAERRAKAEGKAERPARSAKTKVAAKAKATEGGGVAKKKRRREKA